VAYRKALEQRPDDTDLKLRLGAALVTAERLDEANAMLQQVLKERPSSAEAEHFMGRVLLGRGDTAQAVQHLERAVALDAQKPEYHMYLAWALLEQHNLGSALESINQALKRDPNLGDGRWILGRIQLRAGAVKDALKNFELTLKLKPGRVEALADRGDAYDGLRQLAAAIQSYQEAVKARPDKGEWWYRLGTLHLDQGSRDESRVALSEAVLRGDRLFEKPSWLADAHRLYAEVLRDAGRKGEAIEHYRVFLELAPAGHPERDEIARIVRSGAR
jgi:tetratricopeptide (TPR) repeat protein